MRSAIKDQSDMTRITLEHAQIGANIATLDAMVKERDVESNAANAAWEEGEPHRLQGSPLFKFASLQLITHST